MENPYKNKSDDELVVDASRLSVQQGNQAELTRRLMKSIRSLDITTARYSSVLVALTLILLVLGFLQLVLTIFVTPVPIVERFTIGGVFTVFLFLAAFKITKAFLE